MGVCCSKRAPRSQLNGAESPAEQADQQPEVKQSSEALTAQLSWIAASSTAATDDVLVIEDSEDKESWVSAADVPQLDEDSLKEQSLQACFSKQHTSAWRSIFAREWSDRFYELHGGVVHRRRALNGDVIDTFSLDGARICVEASTPSESSQAYIFRIEKDGKAQRLSTQDREIASKWVLALSAASSYFHGKAAEAAEAPTSEDAKKMQ